MGAILACGEDAVLSHQSAAALWGILNRSPVIDITVPRNRRVSRPGITVHSATHAPLSPHTTRDRIPVTSPIQTLVDLASMLPDARLEAAINEADKRDLVAPPELRTAVEDAEPRRPGVARLRAVLDHHALTLTDSHLERLFLPIASRAGLTRPRTQARINGSRVDFFWPDLGLIVETDGLRYHRTATQQARDRIRDQVHTSAGLTSLRFTHRQVAREPEHVERVLRATAERLSP